MDTSRYFYNGQAWSVCPTAPRNDSFFHSILGVRTDEAEEYFDKHAQFRRMRWATFWTYYKNEPKPPSVEDALTKSLSAINIFSHTSSREAQSFTNYISSIIAAERNVMVEEMGVLATLENVKIVLLSKTMSNPIIVEPNPDFLETYPIKNVDEEPDEIVLCLQGTTFFRLEPARDDSFRTTEETALFRENTSSTEHSFGKFKKRGSAGSKGVQYQVYLLTVVLLNTFRNKIGWRLSTENTSAEKFDDIVLESPDGDTFIQSKYKENKKEITLQHLISAADRDFSLPKYFLSYMQLKRKFKVKNIIICTNANAHKQVLRFLTRHQVSTESVLCAEGNDCSFYTFNDEILQDLRKSCLEYYENYYKNKYLEDPSINEETIKDFLQHLQFYFNYPSIKHLTESINKVLSLIRYCNNSRDKMLLSDIYPKMMDWYQQTVGIYLDEIHAKAMFADIWRDKYCHSLEQYKVWFQKNVLHFNDNKQIYQVTSYGGCLLQVMKVYQVLRTDKMRLLFINSDDDIDTQELTATAFAFPSYVYLIVIWNDTDTTEPTEMCDKLKKILQQYYYKKIILIGENIDVFTNQIKPEAFTDIDVEFKDMSAKAQNTLLSKRNIDFQGNNFSLEELLGKQSVDSYNDVIKLDLLERLVKGESIKVGSVVQPLHKGIEGYYIPRKFTRQIEDDASGQTWEWEETYSEEEIFKVSDKFVVIENRGGMGKSTVLNNLAAVIKKNYPHQWVIKLQFNKYKDILKKLLKKNRVDVSITELLNFHDQRELETELEQFAFSLEGKVVLILDAVDEISEDIDPYLGLLLSLFEQCQNASNIAKVFVASREHAIQVLAEKLNVTPFKLLPLEETDYVTFFLKFWTAKLSLAKSDAAKCQTYAEAVVSKIGPWIDPDYTPKQRLVVVPLQLKMFAEIFQERSRFEISEDWDGCKEFLSAARSKPNLPRKVNIAKLFKMLIDKKGDFLIDETDSSDRTACNEMLKKYNEYFAYRKML